MNDGQNGGRRALINDAVIVYLGGGPGDEGVMPPWGSADRLTKRFPSDWESLHEEVLAIVRSMDLLVVDWSQETLKTATTTAKKAAKNKFPWLSDIATAKLASYFAYQWK